jgi:hypothetical protein
MIRVKKGSKTRFKTRFLTLNKKIIHNIKLLNLAFDMEFGYYTYDKLKSLFALITLDEAPYQIPNERVALLEYKRILNIGMSNYIIKVSRNLTSLSDRLLKHYPEIEYHYSRLADIPLFVAIYNSYSRSYEQTRTWILEDDIALYNAAKDIQDLDIDNIHSYDKDRNKIQSLLTYGHIIKQGFKVTNSTLK